MLILRSIYLLFLTMTSFSKTCVTVEILTLPTQYHKVIMGC